MKKGRTRIDSLLVAKGITSSRERARALILSGKVLVNGSLVDKAGTLVLDQANIDIKGSDIPFVSRGGLKLDHALKKLAMDVSGFICMDIGASTGGFTDCLLQRGAQKVYAVDVGYGQLAWSLRQDPRVVVIERTNIRTMPVDVIADPLDLVTVDTSFISLKLVVPAAEKFMEHGTRILALIKPQFEAGRHRIGKGGVVRDPGIREAIIKEISDFFKDRGYETGENIPSPVPGPKGNIEYIISLRYLKDTGNTINTIY